MKICLISRECFPFTHGGIGTAFYSLGKMLANLNHQVILLTLRPPNFDEGIYNQYYTDNFKTEWVNYTEGSFSVHNLLDYSFQLEKHFERFNNLFEADIALYADFDGEMYYLLQEKNKGAKYRNTAFVIHYSGPLFALNEAEKKTATTHEEIIFQMETACIQSSSFAIAPSSFILNYLKKKFDLKHQQHFVIPNPINNTIFKQPAKPSPTPDSDEKIILFIGRLQKTKGVDYLVKAFQQLVEQGNENIKLQLAGRDVYWSDYNTTFQEYCKATLPENILSKIDFTGHISQEEMFTYHKRAWVAVFPSRFETFGNVAVECMYNGTPVIVSKNTGLADAIGNDYKISWDEEKGVEALTALLQKVLAEPALRNELAQQSYKRAMDLHTNLTGQFVTALEKIINTATVKPVPFKDNSAELFLLLNQYSAFREQEKNEDLKKAWARFDEKNKELAALWKQHDEQLKDVWGKYDEKDKQMLDVWKQYDAKDAALQQSNQQYHQLEQQRNELQEQSNGLQQQYTDLQQQYIQFQQYHIESLQRYNDMLQQYNELQQQFSELQQQYNHLLPQFNELLIQHTKLKEQITTLNQDLEKNLNKKAFRALKTTLGSGYKDLFPEIELLYYQINILKTKIRRFF